MKVVSTYPGLLIAPDGTEIRKGDVVEISKETAANAGVLEWIEAGWLVDQKGYKPPVASPDAKALEAERDTLAETNAALVEKLAAMQADLDAATAPKP